MRGAQVCRTKAIRLHSRYAIDYVSCLWYETQIPAPGGASSRDDPEGGAGSGVLRPRLVTAGPGRSGTPPARHYDLAARSIAARIRRKCRRWKRGPRPKIATVERRRGERVPLDARRASPGVAVAPDTRDKRNSAPFRRSARPSVRVGWEEESKTRTQQRAAGTKKTALFEIVNRKWRGQSRRRPRARVPNERAPGCLLGDLPTMPPERRELYATLRLPAHSRGAWPGRGQGAKGLRCRRLDPARCGER